MPSSGVSFLSVIREARAGDARYINPASFILIFFQVVSDSLFLQLEFLSSAAQLGYAKIALALLLRVTFSKITRAGFNHAGTTDVC